MTSLQECKFILVLKIYFGTVQKLYGLEFSVKFKASFKGVVRVASQSFERYNCIHTVGSLEGVSLLRFF